MRFPVLPVAALLALSLTGPAMAQSSRSHAITILGTPALPADFHHFPYVNPDAPKGGEVAFAAVGSFDGFNPYILRGNAAIGTGAAWQPGVGGTGAGSAGGHVWETLMVGSADEVATGYGHLAETVEIADDKSWVAFELRPQARFADGTPVTADDVVWTFQTLKEKGIPSFRVAYTDVSEVVAESPRRVVFRFSATTNRELPLLVGGLPVLPRKWWESRDFTRPLTEPPLGSGPYRVDRFELGRTVTYARNPDWWAKDMPTGRGVHNFDRVRIEYFRDPTIAFEAFKAGQVDYRQENISRQWATGYDFPAVRDKLVRLDVIPHQLPIGLQGVAFNTRRPVFSDARVREALGQVFDFEWMNKTLFYGTYTRSSSYFGNTALESKGLPDQAEAALLEPFRAQLPSAVFNEPFQLPATDASGNNRDGLRRALALLREAGWEVKDRKLVDKDGKQMSFVFLEYDPSLERVILPYIQSLQRLGIDASLRIVDTAQYQRLTDDFDYDASTTIIPGSELPGTELLDEFSCVGAKTQGSSNMPGVCQPAVDALVKRMIEATDQPTLATAGRALDRVLLRGWYMVPGWHSKVFNVATWDRFGKPDKPVRTGFVLDSWWVDATRAARVDAGRRSGN